MKDSIGVLHVDDDPPLAEMTAEFLARGADELSVRTGAWSTFQDLCAAK